MRRSRFYRSAAGILAVAMVAAACTSGSPGASGGGAGTKPYIAIVSKGSQHQFWQAVQKGATDEAAAKGATITYEGPASESEVDKQLTMLQTALDKKPAAICFAALDSKAAGPLLQKAKDAKHPGRRLRQRRRQRDPGHDRVHRQHRGGRRGRGPDGQADRRQRQGRGHRP